jgi:hypothetical protein
MLVLECAEAAPLRFVTICHQLVSQSEQSESIEVLPAWLSDLIKINFRQDMFSRLHSLMNLEPTSIRADDLFRAARSALRDDAAAALTLSLKCGNTRRISLVDNCTLQSLCARSVLFVSHGIE